VLVTDTLASSPPAAKRLLPTTEHRRHKSLNNRAEHSHQPACRRERAIQRFKSPEQAQRFLVAFGPIRQHFCPYRHLLAASAYRHLLAPRFDTWCQIAAPTA